MKRPFFRTTLIIVCIAGACAATYAFLMRQADRKFLNRLSGTVVFLRRDGEHLNVYTIPASGGTPRLVFHNDERTPFKDVGTINQNSGHPRWTDDGTKIRFVASRGTVPGDMNTGGWKIMEMNADGTDIRIVSDDNGDGLMSVASREDDIVVKQGDIVVRNGDRQVKIYDMSGYDPKFKPGASEVSWSPDKQYVIFDTCALLKGCGIFIADREGARVVRLTEGTDPDWTFGKSE